MYRKSQNIQEVAEHTGSSRTYRKQQNVLEVEEQFW
jgi:hypothetical protein